MDVKIERITIPVVYPFLAIKAGTELEGLSAKDIYVIFINPSDKKAYAQQITGSEIEFIYDESDWVKLPKGFTVTLTN